jgi:hypothetical protein
MSTEPPQGSSLTRHYDYTVLDEECQCSVCVDWRQKRDQYVILRDDVAGHNRSCMCGRCKKMRKQRTLYHAAMNRRDLFCEISFLVSAHPQGSRVMVWLQREIYDPQRRDGWWEGRAPYYPLGYWLRRFEAAVVNIVSGAETFVAAVSGA